MSATRRKPWSVRLVAGIVSVCLAAAALVGCGGGTVASGPARSAKLTPATLTVWYQDAPTPSDVAVAHAFERLHPQIKVHFVRQPASDYFTLVHTANLAHNGPDIEYLWPGYYTEQNIPWLVKLNAYFPHKTLTRLVEPAFSALGYNIANGLYAAPVVEQYYIGLYNKKLFAKAGINSPPRDWSELYADCGKLKAIGVSPLDWGNQQDNGSSNVPYVAFELSYLLANALTPQQYLDLYTGKTPWTSPRLVSQVEHWAELYKRGCTNANALSNPNAFSTFIQGKAAMLISGDWALAPGNLLPNSVLRNTAPFAPPFSDEPTHALVMMSSYSYAATSYSPHLADAVAFVTFVDSPTAQRLLATQFNPALSGLPIPPTLNSQHRLLLSWTQHGNNLYPFIDNLLQPAVYSTAQSVLPQAFVGQNSAQAALKSIESSVKALPESQRKFGTAG